MDVSLWHGDTYIVVNPDLHIWWQNTLWYVKLYKFQGRIIKQKCPIWIILLLLIIANTRQIPLYQFMICWTQNFISITVNLYKGLKIALLLFNSNVQVLLLLLPVVGADSFGLAIFRFEPYVSSIVFHRPLQRLDDMYNNGNNIDWIFA